MMYLLVPSRGSKVSIKMVNDMLARVEQEADYQLMAEERVTVGGLEGTFNGRRPPEK